LRDKITRRLALLKDRLDYEVLARELDMEGVERRLRSGLRGRFDASGYYTSVFRQWLEETPRVLRNYNGPSDPAPLNGEALLGQKIHLFDHEIECPLDVNWHREPIFGVVWPKRYVWSLSGHETGSDVVLLWHLNKMMFLLDASYLYRTTGNDAFASHWAGWIRSWVRDNRYMVGMNWRSPMETGTRLFAWSVGLRELGGAHVLSEAVLADIIPSLARQAEFIAENFSQRKIPNNHLIGEAATLFAVAVMWPIFSASPQWRESCENILSEELERQLLPDGTHFENAFNYHAYVLDFYLLYCYAKCLADETPPEHIRRGVTRLAETLLAAISPAGRIPRFGDDSVSEFFLLKPLHQLESMRFSSAVSLRDIVRRDFGAVLEGTEWSRSLLDTSVPLIHSRHLPSSGFSVFRTASSHLVYASGPTHGQEFADGHLHADAASFELEIEGKPLFIDSGTYLYTYDERARLHFKGARAHNTLLVDAVEPLRSTGVFKWAAVPRSRTTWRCIVAGLQGVGSMRSLPSSGSAWRHERIIVQLGGGGWIVGDHLRPDGPVRAGDGGYDVTLMFHTPLEAERFEFLDTHRLGINLGERDGDYYVLSGRSSAGYERSLVTDRRDERTWYSRWYSDLQYGTTVLVRTEASGPLTVVHTLATVPFDCRVAGDGNFTAELTPPSGERRRLAIRFNPTVVELDGTPVGEGSR
jgi:hypothetical protein